MEKIKSSISFPVVCVIVTSVSKLSQTLMVETLRQNTQCMTDSDAKLKETVLVSIPTLHMINRTQKTLFQLFCFHKQVILRNDELMVDSRPVHSTSGIEAIAAYQSSQYHPSNSTLSVQSLVVLLNHTAVAVHPNEMSAVLPRYTVADQPF